MDQTTIDRRQMMAAMAAMGGAIAASATMAAEMPGRRAMTVSRGRLFLPAVIAGRPVEILLDSGAEVTVIDRTFAAGAGLGGGAAVTIRGSGTGTTAATRAATVPVSVARIVVPGVMPVVADLGDLSRRLIGRPLTAIVGREFFDAGRYEIDIAAGWLRPLARGERPRGVRLPLVTEHGIETVSVTIEGRPARATFDLGNGSGVMVSDAFAAGLLADRRPTGTTRGGGLGGEAERRTVTLAQLEVAGRRFGPLPAAIEPAGHVSDANIGTSILSAFRIITDFPGRAVWLGPR